MLSGSKGLKRRPLAPHPTPRSHVRELTQVRSVHDDKYSSASLRSDGDRHQWNPDRHQFGISDRHRWNTHATMAKSFVNSADVSEILGRLATLTPQSKARWGRMNANQMTCHLNDSFRLALGEHAEMGKPNFFTRTIGKQIALWAPMEWPNNLKTMPGADQMIAAANIRPLASHGTPCRYRNRAQCCDTRRHGRSGDQQRGHRRVF